ncbi:hypothetical protein TI05_02975 [Achromatium sp. WMS3]|nr:hypothetical protein TI05_02975 [Achromatium sp. WMS3]
MQNENNESMDQQAEAKSSGVLPWIFGVLFTFGGIGSMGTSFLGGLAVAIAGLVLLPPVKEMIDSKINDENTSSVFRVVFIIAMFGLGVSQMDRAKLADFNNDRPQIIAQLKQTLANKNYQLVISQAQKYAEFADPEIQSMAAQAKAKLDEIEKEKFNANRPQIIASLKQKLANEDYQAVVSQTQQYAKFKDPELESIVAQARTKLAAIAAEKREAARKIEDFELSLATVEITSNLIGITVQNKSDFEWKNIVLYLNPKNEGLRELTFMVHPVGFRAPAEKEKVYISLKPYESFTVAYSDFVHTDTKEFFSTDRYKIVRVHIKCTVSGEQKSATFESE